MICLSDFVVKSAVTKYAIKNYISKSIVVSGHMCIIKVWLLFFVILHFMYLYILCYCNDHCVLFKKDFLWQIKHSFIFQVSEWINDCSISNTNNMIWSKTSTPNINSIIFKTRILHSPWRRLQPRSQSIPWQRDIDGRMRRNVFTWHKVRSRSWILWDLLYKRGMREGAIGWTQNGGACEWWVTWIWFYIMYSWISM